MPCSKYKGPQRRLCYATKEWTDWSKIKGKKALAEFKKEIKIGSRIEMEHTTSKKRARSIAMDHLKEHPYYYTKGIVPMERRLKKIKLHSYQMKGGKKNRK